MRNTKPLIAKTYLYLILLILFIGLLIYVNVYGQLNIPLIYEIKPMDSSLDFFHFEEFADLKRGKLGFYSEITSEIDSDVQSKSDIKTIMTNESYPDMYGIKLIEGNFFNKNMVKDKRHYVVISNSLSSEIFPLTSAVGQTLYIDGFEYNIIGIYDNKDSYWSRLSSDRHERILIPYTSYADYSNQKVTSIAFINDKDLDPILDRIKTKYPYQASNSNYLDFKEKRNYSTQFITLLLTYMQIITIIFVFALLYKVTKGYINYLISHRDDYHLIKLILHNKRYLFLFIFTIVTGTTLIIFLNRNLHFEVSMSSWFAPSDRLLDFSHYSKKILDFFVSENSRSIIGNDYHYKLINATLYISVILTIFIYPIMLLFISKLKKLVKTYYIFALEMLGYLIIILLVCFIINIFSTSFYMEKILSVLIYFLLMLIMVSFTSLDDTIIKRFLRI